MARVRSSLLIALAAVLFGPAAWPRPAAAGFQLDARYSGVVVGIRDTYGVFGPVSPGDSVEGIIRYSGSELPFLDDPTGASYELPVTPGGPNLMTLVVGALDVRTTQTLLLDVYNLPDPNPADSFFGYVFQFNDGDVGPLSQGGLPSGYQLKFLDGVVGLFTTDVTRLNFPDPPTSLPPPSSLLPLDQYDSWATGGSLVVQVRDASGRFVEFANIDFQLTSLTAVPEPSSALLAAMGLPAVVIWARRRRSGWPL